MIFDKLENLEHYRGVYPRFDRALPFLLDLIAQNADVRLEEVKAWKMSITDPEHSPIWDKN